MDSKAPRSGRALAFTLIELLVAAGSAAVLVAALLAAFSSAWRLQGRAHERDIESAAREAAVEQLARDLRNAVPPVGILAGPLLATAWQVGDWRHDDVQWVSASGGQNPDDAGADLVGVRYALAPGATPAHHDLVRTENRWRLAVHEQDTPAHTLLEGVVSFAASWYDGEAWTTSWDSTVQDNQLPQAARIRIDFADHGGQRPQPLEMIVPLLVRSALVGGEARP